MAIQTVINSIDEYLKRLRAARALLARYSESPTPKQQGTLELLQEQKQKLATKARPAPSTPAMVAVQVLPSKSPRNRRTLTRPKETASALGGAIPQAPIVVRRADVVKLKTQATSTQAIGKNKSSPATSILQDLANEVSKRLGQANGPRLV